MNSILATLIEWLRCLWGNSDSLRRRTIVGSNWLMVRGVARSCLELVKTAIFARILFPEDYGLMALAMLAIGLLESLTGMGMEIKLQSDEDEDPGRLHVYWTVKALRGVLLFCLAWVLALPLADAYARPELAMVVRFLGVMFIFDGCSGFGREICQREMNFKRAAVVDSICYVIAVGAGLVFLFFSPDFRALAFYNVVSSFCMMLSSYAFFDWRPRFRMERQALKGMLAFSASIFFANVLNYLFNNLDKGVIGKLLSVEQLGLYTRAYYLALLPVSYIFQAIAPVILNAFRHADDESGRLFQVFWKTAAVFSALSLGVAALFFTLGPVIIKVVYGEKWLAALPAFNVLLIYGVTKAVVAACSPVFFIRRKPWMISAATTVMVGAFALICYPLTAAYGMVGAAWAVVISGAGANILGIALCVHVLLPSRSAQRHGSLSLPQPTAVLSYGQSNSGFFSRVQSERNFGDKADG